jgi:hypothetical protein
MFDHGGGWRFVVEVIGLGRTAAKARYPKVLKKVGKAPEQYGARDETRTTSPKPSGSNSAT